MRVSTRNASLILLAAACGWFVRGVGSPAPAVVATKVERAAIGSTPSRVEVAPRRVDTYAPVAHAARSGRNLFAYREAPPARIQRVATPRVIDESHPLVERPAPVVVNAPPAFNYRFIGTFGPPHNRIAAFSRDGEIVTARAGDRIGAEFVLRAIGLESVEIESASGTQRVPLG